MHVVVKRVRHASYVAKFVINQRPRDMFVVYKLEMSDWYGWYTFDQPDNINFIFVIREYFVYNARLKIINS